jgi:hypothetical protein
MDEKDRTCCARLEVPEHLVPILRRTAEEVLERACDAGDEWNDEIRDRVLDAARLVEVFDIGVLAPDRLGELAAWALEWAEPNRSSRPRRSMRSRRWWGGSVWHGS